MSYLLIDIGNSYIKYAVYAQNKLLAVNKLTHEQFFAELQSGHLNLTEQPQAIVLVSVIDEASVCKIKEQLSQTFQCSIQQVLTSETTAGVTCGYSDYTLLGADRWVAMVAAFKHAQNSFLKDSAAILVVDCGTVVTADVVDNTGQHAGGWMMPGSLLMTDVLVQKASGIHAGLESSILLQSRPLQPGPGSSTADCVIAGSTIAIVGFIEQCFIQAEQRLQQKPLCILTGGGAEELMPLLSITVKHLPELVLEGLVLFIE